MGKGRGREGPATGAAEGAAGRGQNDPNYKAEVSYALGRNFAMGLKEGQVDCDLQIAGGWH